MAHGDGWGIAIVVIAQETKTFSPPPMGLDDYQLWRGHELFESFGACPGPVFELVPTATMNAIHHEGSGETEPPGRARARASDGPLEGQAFAVQYVETSGPATSWG